MGHRRQPCLSPSSSTMSSRWSAQALPGCAAYLQLPQVRAPQDGEVQASDVDGPCDMLPRKAEQQETWQ